MRDDNSGTPALGRVLLVALILVLLILTLPGCVTIANCDTRIKSRMVLSECEWDFGRPLQP